MSGATRFVKRFKDNKVTYEVFDGLTTNEDEQLYRVDKTNKCSVHWEKKPGDENEHWSCWFVEIKQ